MSENYVEEFHIDELRFSISEDRHKQCRVWLGGSSIALCPSRAAARQHIHDEAKRRLSVSIDRMERALVHSRETLKHLGDDPFYLGRFMLGDEGKKPE